MITAKGIADNENLDKLFKLFDKYTEQVFDLADETFKELQPKHLQAFQRQPRVRSYPGDYPGGQLPFDTERQRRWYWANIGKPYKRTGRMANSLQQTINRTPQRLDIVARYGASSTKYVLGNIHGEEVQAFQQRFHKATGWQLAAPLLKQQAQTYVDQFTRRYEAFIAFYAG